MELLRNYYVFGNVNFAAPLKRITFILLICIYLAYSDMCKFPKAIEKIYEHDKILKINFTRLLAKYEQNTELEHTRLREKLSDRRPYKYERNAYENISTCSRVKRKAPNNIDVYMKNYKNRYMKKRGLSKLDCYYENKVFDKFNRICDIGKKMQNDTKRSKSFFLKKYGIGLIIFALIPALGLIYYILFGVGDKPGIFGLCDNNGHFEGDPKKHTKAAGNGCQYKWFYDHKPEIAIAGHISMAFSFIMIIIVLSIFFYILIKVIKYEKIKAGKGKMSINEYSRFSKDIFL